MKTKIFFCLSVSALITSLGPTAHAQTFSVIHHFTGGSDGSLPQSGVTIRGGDLFGTASAGGPHFWGVVYQAKRSGNWSISPLSYLPISGNAPLSRALFGPDGHLYGTTADGGSNVGNVYSLTAPPSICATLFCPWHETEIHNFSGQGGDGRGPASGDLAWDQQGNIYGTTVDGGQHGLGVVYELMRSGNNWTEVPIYSFSGPDGSGPYAGVVIDSKGNLFGTTRVGGANDLGAIYELQYQAGVGWKETVLYSFQNTTDGALPFGGLIFDSTGNLYGTAVYGGSALGGTVFELSPSGNTWSFNLLYSLSGFPDQGCGSVESLAFDTAGNLYGTTICDGSLNSGTAFKLSKTANGWTYNELHAFDPASDGNEPICSVAIDSDGTLYGTANAGGLYNKGTLWMIKP